MSTGSVFVNNRTQAVRLPADARFPDEVKQVSVRVVGKDRILSPVENSSDAILPNTGVTNQQVHRSQGEDFAISRLQ